MNGRLGRCRNRIRVTTLSILALFSCAYFPVREPQPRHPTIRLAAAADLRFAMRDLAAQFEKQTGTNVEVTYGSSGNFFAQIENGAPFDLFFSADMNYPRKLQAAGLAEPGTLCEYAIGQMVIWTLSDAKTDVAHQGWKALFDASVQKVALANPEHAPYGRAAVAALRTAGIYEQLLPKLVYGENAAQAAQFVQSGNAQAGLLPLSLALSPAMNGGKWWDVPADTYPAIEQGAIVLKRATNKAAARSFLDFVKSEAGRRALGKYGFALPAESQPASPRS